MKLKTRLTLIFLVMALVPLGVVLWLLSSQAETDFQRSFAEQREALEETVRARFAGVGRTIDDALKRMAGDAIVQEELLEPLERQRFYSDAQRMQTIVLEAERLMKSSAIDTLALLDREKGGYVIALGHRRGFDAEDDGEGVRMGVEHGGETFLRLERRQYIHEATQEGTIESVWTLQVARCVGPRLVMVGGKILDETVVNDLLSGGGDARHARFSDSQGRRIAGVQVTPDPAHYAEGVIAMRQPGRDEVAARLHVYVSRAGLQAQVASLWRTVGWLAGGSIVLALLAGIWMSRRLSRPLERLAAAADDVAGGARDTVVPELAGQDEIAGLTRAFNAMTMDLADSESRLKQSERIAAWREIARRIAHEIKNPLFPIQMSIENLKKVHERKHADFEEIFEESTRTVLEEVGRMKRIVTEFSDFARMPAPEPQLTDLKELAADVVSLHRAGDPQVTLSLEGESAHVDVDQDQFHRVVTNLVQNALEATRDKARASVVIVRVAPDSDGTVALSVKDDGPGMEPETLDRLFTPYFTTKSGGTGLGLAIVHRIVSEHGGSISVDSSPGQGACFTLRLPAFTRDDASA